MLRLRPLAVLLSFALALCLLGLWSARSQTGALRRVTNTTDEGKSINPSLSGDGRRIAFESTEDLGQAGGTDHFRAIRADLSLDPATFVQMGGTRAPAPGISQDGSIIAFAAKENPLGTNADGNSEIFLFDGANLRQITNTTPNDISSRVRDGNFQPSLSDDGRFIAFSSNRNLANQNGDGNLEIFIFDAVSDAFTQLTNTAGAHGASDAKISGDGSRVAYIRDVNALPAVQRDLMLQDRAGGTTRILANNVTNLALTYGRAISDDGLRVVYSGDIAPNSSQVYLFDGRTTNASRQITVLGEREADVPLHPTISGDGTRISFATRRPLAVTGSNSDNSIELYTYDVPTGQFNRVTNVTTSLADGFNGSNRVTEVVSSLNDDGSIVAFNFPRALSGTVGVGLENNSEIYVTGTAARPTTGSLTILNEASFGHEPSTTKAVAPESRAVALGGALAFNEVQSHPDENGNYPTSVDGTTVTVNGRPAQIFFVSPTQVTFLVPPQTEVGTATVVVTNSEGFQSRGTVAVMLGAPGIYTESGDGLGKANVLNADTGTAEPFDPSDGNLRLIILTTGVRKASQVTVTAGGRELTVESIMDSPDMPGMDEIRVLVPADLRGAGVVNLVVRADGRDSNPATVNFSGNACRDIVINEVLADPFGSAATDLEGDANHDNIRDTEDDEFVELVNTTGTDKDISGYQLLTRSSTATTDTVRHTFPAGTFFPAHSAIVIFGGGAFDANNPVFGGAQVFRATSSSGLSLTNSGGVVTLREPSGAIANIFSYGGSTGLRGDTNQSLTRSPDAGVNNECGNFTPHSTADGSNGTLFSPGTQVNGAPFAPGGARLTSVTISPSSLTIAVGQTTQFTAQARDQFNRPLTNVTITFASDDTNVATIDGVTFDADTGIATATVTGRGEGTAHITAQATNGATTVTSSPATLTVNPLPPAVSRVEISPSNAAVNRGQTQQFTATAFDPNNQPIAGAVFAWTSSDPNIATIDANGLATGVGLGSVTITATTSDATGATTSGTATLTVQIPLVINEIHADVVTDNEATTAIEGDANRDGIRNSGDDEFIEFLNNSNAAVDISGVIIADATSNRFTIPADTILEAGRALIIFGGGTPDPSDPAFGGALVIAIPGTLSLNDTGDTVNAKLNFGGTDHLITSVTYGGTGNAPAPSNQSLTRSPDAEVGTTGGDFVAHDAATNAAGRTFSPGTRADGTPFGSPPITRIEVTPASAAIDVAATQTFTARAFSNTFGPEIEVQNVSFIWDSSDPSKATVAPTTGQSTTATGVAPGNNIGIRARAGGQEGIATLTVNASPTTSTYIVTGQVVDTNNNPISGVLITFELNSGGTLSTQTTQTDANGNYSSGDLGTCRNNVKVTPSKAGLTFTPAAIAFTSTGCLNGSDVANFTGTPPPPGTLVISQIYGGGGNSGATYTHDYVEIFNSGTTTIDFSVTPYSIQYIGTSGSFGSTSASNKTNITSGTIAPGQYFLVQEASGGAVGAALPLADATGSINLAATGGKVALVVGTAALPTSTCPGDDGASPFNPSNAAIADFVGYGGSANTVGHCYEGPAPAAAPSNTSADFRKAGGCVDTNFNGDDFLVAAPTPRNTGSPLNDCSAGLTPEITINDASAISESTANATFTVTLSLSSASTITVNYATTDGTAVAGDDYQSTSGTLTFAPGETTKSILVPIINDTLDEPQSETFFVNLTAPTNATLSDGQGQGTITDDDAAANAANLVISQVYGGGGNSGATYQHDFIEIFNQGPTTVDFSVTPYSVQYASAGANFSAGNKTDLTSGTIAPGQYFLIQEGSTNTASCGDAPCGVPLPTPDASGNIGMAATSGKVALVVGTAILPAAICPGDDGNAPFNPSDGTIVDFIGYGSVSCYEGTGPAPAPSNTTADFRKVGGCQDTDDNAADFLAAAPSPRNSGSPVNNCNAPNLTIDDVSVTEGDTGTVTATFTVSLSAPAPAGGVAFNIATQDNTATVADNDYVAKSLTGQTIAGGQQTYTFTVTINGDTKLESNETFFVNVTNVSGANLLDGQGQGTIVNDDAADLVISQIYGGGGNSGAPYQHDFIEIFNRGTTPVDFSVTPYSVHYASAGANFSATNKTDLTSGTIAPGGYFLIQEGSTNTASCGSAPCGVPLPQPDATGNIGMAATSGKVVLVVGTATLPAEICPGDDGTAPFNPNNATIVDFVGYGSVSCYEGTDRAPAPSGTTADFRKSGGCQDTDDNAADFLVAGPNPRNTSSPANDCSAGLKPEITINNRALSESTTPVDFTVTLSTASTLTVTVDYATADGTATAGSDYQATSGTLTFAPGETTKTISVTVINDTVDEANETYFVNLTNATNSTILDSQGQGTINDNDSPPTISIDDTSVTEGDSGTTSATFNVSLSAASGQTVTVNYATADNTATAGTDYQAASGTLTFTPGQTSQTITVLVNGDTTFESDETFLVDLTAPANATLLDAQGQGTITNDEPAPPVPLITIDDVSVAEGDSGTKTVNFTVSLSMNPTAPVTVDYATADVTATAGTDYQATSGTLTFNTGETSKTITVTINGDTLVESNETFIVKLTNAANSVITDDTGLGTITNDDTANVVISQVYGGGGNTGATYNADFIELFNRGTTPVDITSWSVQYSSGASTSGDFSVTPLCPTGTCSIPAGGYFLVKEASGGANGNEFTADVTGTITMSATGGKVALVINPTPLSAASTCSDLLAAAVDFVGYGSTANCFEGAGNAPTPSATLSDFRRAGGCQDTNDNAADFFTHTPFPRSSQSPLNNCSGGATPDLSINDVTVTEGNTGTVTATFTVSLSTPANGSDVTFNIATQNNTATTADNDYESRSLTNQVIPAGVQTYTFNVTVNGDTVVEPNETFFVNVSNVSGANLVDGQGVGTIQNDDLPTISINDVSQFEGNAGTTTFTFTVSLSDAPTSNVTFDIATADGTAQDDNPTTEDNDYVARSLTGQTILAGQQTFTFDVTVNGDAVNEPAETFLVNLTNVSGATFGDAQGVGTIQNDDVPTLTINNVAQAEGNSGQTIFTFTVHLTMPAPAGGVTFDIATADATAQDDNPITEDNDYVARSVTGATIPEGSQDYTFDVQVNGDTLVEPDETFTVTVTNVTGAPVANSQGVGTIQNDDTADLVISQVYGGGGNSGATYKQDFIEIFNRGTTRVDLAGWSVQYNSAADTDNWSVTPLCPTGTCLLEPGQYFLVQEAAGAGGTTDLPNPDATGTIIMAAGSGKVALVSNTTPLTGACPAADASILDIVGYGSTATCFEGTAPAPAPSATVADFREGGGCVDTDDNAADFFTFTPTPRNRLSPFNNCSGGQTTDITISDRTVTEGNSGTVSANFTVTLHGTSASPVTVDFSTADGTAVSASDYQPASGTLTFNTGETSKIITVLVNGDLVDELDETFFVNLTNASANAHILDGQGLGTILDDDLPAILTVGDVSQNEGDSGTTTFAFNVHLSAPAPAGGVTFDISTADGTAQDDNPTTEDSDYVANSVTGATIAEGLQDYTFNVTVNGDTVIEPNETFFVNVSNVTGATLTGGDSQGQGTILNDDSPQLSIADVTQAEGDSGATIFTFTVHSSLPAPAGGITFDISTADVTAQDDNPATEDNDYVAKTVTGATIPEGSQDYIFQVTVNGDTFVEPDETFTVTVSNVTNAGISDGQAIGTITNDDVANVVISQVYGGGGNTGAVYTHDFIEIFNRGTTRVDLAGWSVQYNSAAGTGNWSVTPLCPTGPCLLEPGQYFLVQEAAGAGGTIDPDEDVAGTIPMTAGAGKVALVSNTTALSGACPAADASILDRVGYGSTATCFEGTAPTAAPSNTTAAFREGGGCVDTNDNAADFFIHAPVPRNMDTPLNVCNAGKTTDLFIDETATSTVTEGNSGTVSATFTVRLFGTSASPVTVDYSTADNTAIAPGDYTAIPTTQLTFNPGETQKTITVLVNGDLVDETDETFFVNLTNASTNAVIVDSQAVGTITDDDAAPIVTVSDVLLPEGNSGTTTFAFNVHLSAPAPAGGVTFDITTADGTAFDGNPAGEDTDYVANSVTGATIAAGDQDYAFNVSVNGDTVVEPNETFFVNVTNVTGATLTGGDGQGQGTIQNDDSAPVVVDRIEVTPTSATITVGGTQQFTAKAYDASNNELSGVTFTWNSSDTTVATINSSGLATGLSAGTTQITASSGAVTSNSATLTVARKPNALNELIINEVLARTDTTTNGDANMDGDSTGQRDEFVEIINNTSVTLNLSGLRLYDNTTTTRHIFPANTFLQPGKAIIIFGGENGTTTNSGIPGIADNVDSRTNTATNATFGGAIVQVASQFNLGVATTSALQLNDTGTPADVIRIVDGTITSVSPLTVNGTLIAEASFPASTVNRSFSRNDNVAPVETGGNRNFTAADIHPQVTNAASIFVGKFFSPGFKRDGVTPF